MGRSSRMSLGGSALRDASSRSNMRSSSAPRRMSFGCSPSSSQEETDGTTQKKDRRALLEEWRKQARNRDKDNTPEVARGASDPAHEPSSTSSSSPAFHDDHGDNKRIKLQPADSETPSLPPAPRPPPAPTSSSVGYTSSSGAGTGGGSTALERYRMRKQQREQQQNFGASENDAPSLRLPPQPPMSSTTTSSTYQQRTICFSDDDYDSSTSRSSATPVQKRSRRRQSISSGAKRKARRSMSSAQMTRERRTHAPANDSSDDQASGNLISASSYSSNEGLDSIEGAGLRSRVLEMQQRITQLEKEKMDLSMSKAPLEARFRQKEDAWVKEQNRLLHEIETLKSSSKEADEKCRNLEMKNEALSEENQTLRFAARKAASSLNAESSCSDDTWSRQLQNDRDVAELKDKLRHAEEEIKSLRLEKVSIESEVNGTKLELTSLLRDYDELQGEFDELEASKSQNSEAEIQLQVLTTEHIATSAQLNAVCADLAATKSSAQAEMEEKEEQWKKEVADLKFEVSVLKTRGGHNGDDDQSSAIDDGIEDEAVLKARIEERDARIAELESQLLKGEQIRRMMHNRIQELRGNIRVFVRTRPFLPSDGPSDQSSIEVLPDGESLVIEDQRSKSTLDFKFDKVFAPSSGQDSVFDEVSEFVQSALDGYHVCLFSYGQTGSGKTHTMQGSGNGAMRGIIPRAVEQILSQSKVLQNQKWKFTMSASFLEIYNEDLRDLLTMMKPGSASSRSASSKKPNKLAIKRNAEGKSFVDGLTHVTIDTENSESGMEQLDAVMAAAARARSVATTKMNAQSSRSHSVFMLHLNGINEDSGTVVQGALNLCDLAGSERLDRSGAGSDIKRLKETQAINKSLSCLGDVFNALANGSKHVPFRNSKLTYLLQDCLSGDGKALMFVNLSPTIASGNESLCSLRFAQRVNQVELGKPTKHVEYSKGGSRR